MTNEAIQPIDVLIIGAGPAGLAAAIAAREAGVDIRTGARVEARWDPESVGEDLPSAIVTTGADGRAILTVNMLEGPSGSLSLLLSISLGGTVEIESAPAKGTRVSLRLPVAQTQIGNFGLEQSRASVAA